MRHDDLHITPVCRHLVQMHGVAEGQLQTTATAHTRANATVASVKNRGQFVFVDDLVDRPSHLVVRVVALHRGVELEAANALLFDESLGLACTHLALVRVDTGKGNHHVAVVSGSLGDFFIGDAPPAHLRLGVYGKHHQANLAFAVIGYGFFNGWATV